MNIVEDQIPVNEYRRLRQKCGLSPKTVRACELGLGQSVYSIMVKEGGTIIGMGRIIGDGGCFCQVVDICVVPEMQGKGIGTLIMEEIMKFVDEKLPESCYVSLIADGRASDLYVKYGFKDTLPESRGMYFRR